MKYLVDVVYPRIDENIRFISGVLMPPAKKLRVVTVETNFIKTLRKEKLSGVKNYEEMINWLNENSSKLPLISGIEYKR